MKDKNTICYADKIIEQEFHTASHSPFDGKLYMPSQRWGGWIIPGNTPCSRHSLGYSNMKTKADFFNEAVKQVVNYKGKAYVFKRSTPCVLVAKFWWDEANKSVKSESYS